MKAYSIGREMGCDIVIYDATDVISRRHAILNVMPSGKMTIVDQSHNGTYVNGIRISQNVPVPVTRKDNISFAHVARLDWNMVPKTTTPMQYAMMAVIALVVIAGAVIGYAKLSGGTDDPSCETNVAAVDSATIKQQAKEKADSIERAKKKEKADSVQKADSVKREQKRKEPAARSNDTNNVKPTQPQKTTDTGNKPKAQPKQDDAKKDGGKRQEGRVAG